MVSFAYPQEDWKGEKVTHREFTWKSRPLTDHCLEPAQMFLNRILTTHTSTEMQLVRRTSGWGVPIHKCAKLRGLDPESLKYNPYACKGGKKCSSIKIFNNCLMNGKFLWWILNPEPWSHWECTQILSYSLHFLITFSTLWLLLKTCFKQFYLNYTFIEYL